MCGIAGVIEFSKAGHVDGAALRRMCDVMAHRGPDDDGTLIRGRVGLGMRRLSIIDVATGHQPINNEDGTIWIVLTAKFTTMPSCGSS